MAPTWAEIRGNYTADIRPAFDRLMGFDRMPASGHLLLLSGPPGTGKTTILRALARAWQAWCRTEVLMDAEAMFASASALDTLLMSQADGARLIVAEDCDQLITASARVQSGPGLSRLLNVTDGLIGQGAQMLVVLTTNEPVAKLHPAIVRPGRCLANVHVPALTAAEATAWLGRPVMAPATLAELYALRADAGVVGDGPIVERPGQYL